MNYLIAFLIGALFLPAARELWKSYKRDGWDRMSRQRVKTLRNFYRYYER